MGVKTVINSSTPSTTHTTAAQKLGRTPTPMLANAAQHATDMIQVLEQCVSDMSVGAAISLSAAAVASGGSGYAANDLLNFAGGAQVKVVTVSGNAIATVSVQTAGSLVGGCPPLNPASQLSTTGNGSGATLNLTWTSSDANVATFLTQLNALS
jgi:hypothetical protein